MVPLVSVIVPIYNSEEYISICLESIINQSYSKLEIILINDGSTDRSEEIINHYLIKDNRIVYINQKNSGPSEARNKGLGLVTGEYIIFVDSDDSIESEYIEFLIEEMIALDADIIFCGYKDHSSYGIIDHTDFKIDTQINEMSKVVEMVCNGTGGVLWSKMFKNDIISSRNLKMDKNIFMSEDLIFVLQYVSYCNKFGSINSYLYNYNRFNQRSISSNISIKYTDNYISVCKYLEKILETVDLESLMSKQIIIKRLQDYVLKVVDQQCINVKQIGLREASQNINDILSIPYINNYLSDFNSEKKIMKPQLFFIRNKFISLSIIYGSWIYTLKNVKRKIPL